MQSIAPKSSVNAVSSRLSARMLLVALAAVFAVLAITPYLSSATPPGRPPSRRPTLSPTPGDGENHRPEPGQPLGPRVGPEQRDLGRRQRDRHGHGLRRQRPADSRRHAPDRDHPAPGSSGASSPRPAWSPTPRPASSSRPRPLPARARAVRHRGRHDRRLERTVDPTHAIIAVDNSASGAVYKGLALGFNATGASLYATNFHAGTVDVFDSKLQARPHPRRFTDSGIPAGYAPFGIQAINGNLLRHLRPAGRQQGRRRRRAGARVHRRLRHRGPPAEAVRQPGQLNSPWGMAWAPFEGFGEFNNALLVGNFGDGSINAFDFDSGEFLGKLSDASGKPITIPGSGRSTSASASRQPRPTPSTSRPGSTTNSTGSSARWRSTRPRCRPPGPR